MRSLRVAVSLAVAITLASVVPGVALDTPVPPTDGEVVRVSAITDGDTIRVERADGTVERVRYIGIDTPETGHAAGEPDEPWGREATDANRRLVEEREVLLERDVSEVDRYDRLLRYVWVEQDDGWHMVNGELVALGLADVRAYEPDTRYHEWFRQLQEEARAAGLGMYAEGPADDGDLLEAILEFLFGS